MKLLLHACCGPCSTAVIERIKEKYDLTVFFYNPNIHPREEYELRLKEAKKVYKHFNVPLIIGEYNPKIWIQATQELADEVEGAKRCAVCYELRLRRTFLYAKEHGFDAVTTTITISPHHKAPTINGIGKRLSAEYGVSYLTEDFKKKDGFLRSTQLSKELKLYRQEYCGCMYSRLDCVMRQNL